MNDEVERPPEGGDRDNLEDIDGIGPGYAEALYTAGILTFADLATYDSSEALQQTLREQADTDVPLWKIERFDWIGQAQAKLEVVPPAPKAEDESDKPSRPTRSNWRQHAGFSIFFDYVTDDNGDQKWQTRVWQTRAYHDESGDEVQFSGVEPRSWLNWILDRADFPKDVAPAIEVVENNSNEKIPSNAALVAESPPPETRLEFLDVTVFEIGPSSAVPEKQLQTEVRFQITGPSADDLSSSSQPYRLEVHTVDRESGESNLVASGRGQLKPGNTTYTSQQRFSIPEVGRYHLHYILLLLPPADLVGYYQGPTIRIVP